MTRIFQLFLFGLSIGVFVSASVIDRVEHIPVNIRPTPEGTLKARSSRLTPSPVPPQSSYVRLYSGYESQVFPDAVTLCSTEGVELQTVSYGYYGKWVRVSKNNLTLMAYLGADCTGTTFNKIVLQNVPEAYWNIMVSGAGNGSSSIFNTVVQYVNVTTPTDYYYPSVNLCHLDYKLRNNRVGLGYSDGLLVVQALGLSVGPTSGLSFGACSGYLMQNPVYGPINWRLTIWNGTDVVLVSNPSPRAMEWSYSFYYTYTAIGYAFNFSQPALYMHTDTIPRPTTPTPTPNPYPLRLNALLEGSVIDTSVSNPQYYNVQIQLRYPCGSILLLNSTTGFNCMGLLQTVIQNGDEITGYYSYVVNLSNNKSKCPYSENFQIDFISNSLAKWHTSTSTGNLNIIGKIAYNPT